MESLLQNGQTAMLATEEMVLLFRCLFHFLMQRLLLCVLLGGRISAICLQGPLTAAMAEMLVQKLSRMPIEKVQYRLPEREC